MGKSGIRETLYQLAKRFAKKCEVPGDSRFWRLLNFFFCQVMILYGTALYKKIRAKNPDKTLLLFSTNSAGDALMYGYFRDYLYRYIGSEEVVHICSDYQSRPLEAIGARPLCPLGRGKIAALSMAAHFYGRDKIDIVTAYGTVIPDHRNITNKELRPHPPRFEFDSEAVDRQLAEAGCAAGKTVVLSPYANSLWDLGEKRVGPDFWHELAEALKDAGYCVCTNGAGGEAEPPVPGTKRIFPKFGECEELVSRAGAAVVLRSGFADYVALTRGTLITLYPSVAYWNRFQLGVEEIKNKHELICDGAWEDEEYRSELVTRIVGLIKNEKAD